MFTQCFSNISRQLPWNDFFEAIRVSRRDSFKTHGGFYYQAMTNLWLLTCGLLCWDWFVWRVTPYIQYLSPLLPHSSFQLLIKWPSGKIVVCIPTMIGLYYQAFKKKNFFFDCSIFHDTGFDGLVKIFLLRSFYLRFFREFLYPLGAM